VYFMPLKQFDWYELKNWVDVGVAELLKQLLPAV